MSETAVKIENLSKQYRLGVVGTQTLRGDLQRFWWNLRGKGDPALKIGQENKLSKAGGDYVWALNNINLEIKKGEVLGIIGKNGAGKSTLLKILSRVTGPTTGSVKVNGRLASLLEVGTGFHPELTGRENIFLNGAILGMSKREIKNKLDEIVDFAGIAKYLDTPVKRYSSGMYVRLAFAVAAHLDSEILVVDEVLAVGDAEFQKKAIGKMQDVSKGQGRTVLFVSHNMGSIQRLCSKGVLLNQGQIFFDGGVNETIQNYLNFTEFSSQKPEMFSNNIPDGKKIILQNIVLKNKKNENINVCMTGADLKIDLNYIANEFLKKVIVRLMFYSYDRTLLFICNNYHSKEHFNLKELNGTFSCTIPKVPLNPGSYSVDIRIVADGKVEYDAENGFALEVVDGDFFGTGKLPAIKHGVLVDHKWQ